jgi:hypothetical protein
MRRSWSIITCSVLVGVAGAAWAGQPDTKPAKPPAADPATKPAKPDAKPAEGAEPSMEEMMAAWMAAATPGPNHEHLAKGVGVWDGKVKTWTDPSQPPSESTCVTTIESMLDGRFTSAKVKGEMKFGEHSMPFEGFGLYGFNNTTQKFESIWADNLGTLIMSSTGELSADKKTMTWTGSFIDPATKQKMTMREVDTTIDDNTARIEFYSAGPDGNEIKMMQIDSVRRPGHNGKSHNDHTHDDHGKDAGKGKK